MVGYAFATRKNYTKLLKWSTRFACWLIKQYTVFVYFSFFQNQNEQWTHWLLHTYICTELSWLNIYLKTKYITIAIITIFVFKTNFLEVYICGLTIKWILWVSRDLWNFENKQKHFPKLETKFKSCSYKISALDNNVFNIVAKSNLRVERFKVSNSCNKTSINSSFEFLQILQNHREQLRTPVFFNFSKIVSTIWVSTFFPRR